MFRLANDPYDPAVVQARIDTGVWAQWRKLETAVDNIRREADPGELQTGTGVPWEPPSPYDPYKPYTNAPQTRWEKIKLGIGTVVRVFDRFSDLF